MRSKEDSQQKNHTKGENLDDTRGLEEQCDYLVVGAGTSGMSFVDTIITEKPSATVVIVDRNDVPGGHWVHVYPFCKLHAPSCNYGVNSVPLGKNVDSYGNERYDVQDRATGEEVVEYYKKVCKKFKATGRVKCFFGVEYDKFDEERGVHIIVPKSHQDEDSHNKSSGLLNVRCGKLVKISNNVIVPSMRKPMIPVHENVSFVSVNNMPSSVKTGKKKFNNYIVFGCGKTGADAIVTLFQHGIDQSQITWIVSRDVWYFVREAMEDFWGSFDMFMKPASTCSSVKDIFLDWEKNGLLGRIDPNGPFPKVFKGANVDAEELKMMQSIKNVVRMGRATSVEENRILLEQGSLTFSSEDTLLVDCMVDGFHGYGFPKDFKIFEPGRINLGPLTIPFNSSYSAAHHAFLECALDDDESKNNCCYFVRDQPGKSLDHYENMIGGMYLQGKGDQELMKISGGSKFTMSSRTNIVAPIHHSGGIFRLLWAMFGPQQGFFLARNFAKKVESKGYSDLDHCFEA